MKRFVSHLCFRAAAALARLARRLDDERSWMSPEERAALVIYGNYATLASGESTVVPFTINGQQTT